jgi:hypothetical protein
MVHSEGDQNESFSPNSMVRGAPSEKTPVPTPTRTTEASARVVPLTEPGPPVRMPLKTFPGMLKFEKLNRL